MNWRYPLSHLHAHLNDFTKDNEAYSKQHSQKQNKIQEKNSNASITKLGFAVNFSHKFKPRIKVHSTKQQNNYTT